MPPVTNQQAREWIAEIRVHRPQKRIGRTVFELRPDGRLDTYTTNKALTRMYFVYVTNPTVDYWYLHPDLMAWYLSRWNDGAWFPEARRGEAQAEERR